MKRRPPDDDAVLYERCASCDEWLLRSGAFKDGYDYYHAECAGVLFCWDCGEWHEKGTTCPCKES